MSKSILGDIASFLYKISRTTGKSASTVNTIKTVLTGDPEKIAKHVIRKQVYKSSNKAAKKISGKIK